MKAQRLLLHHNQSQPLSSVSLERGQPTGGRRKKKFQVQGLFFSLGGVCGFGRLERMEDWSVGFSKGRRSERRSLLTEFWYVPTQSHVLAVPCHGQKNSTLQGFKSHWLKQLLVLILRFQSCLHGLNSIHPAIMKPSTLHSFQKVSHSPLILSTQSLCTLVVP